MRLRPDWNFEKMGIGGLDTEFSDIFRRAFASRVFDSSFVQKLGIKHVKGKYLASYAFRWVCTRTTCAHTTFARCHR
jgi:hypothetical protein